MKDIKTLFEAAKSSGKPADATAYVEAVDKLLQTDPYGYLSEAEYIISSGYGAKQFIEFIETFGLPIAMYDYVYESTQKIVKRGEVYGKKVPEQRELLKYLEAYKAKYSTCFDMYEYIINDDPDASHYTQFTEFFGGFFAKGKIARQTAKNITAMMKDMKSLLMSDLRYNTKESNDEEGFFGKNRISYPDLDVLAGNKDGPYSYGNVELKGKIKKDLKKDLKSSSQWLENVLIHVIVKIKLNTGSPSNTLKNKIEKVVSKSVTSALEPYIKAGNIKFDANEVMQLTTTPTITNTTEHHQDGERSYTTSEHYITYSFPFFLSKDYAFKGVDTSKIKKESTDFVYDLMSSYMIIEGTDIEADVKFLNEDEEYTESTNRERHNIKRFKEKFHMTPDGYITINGIRVHIDMNFKSSLMRSKHGLVLGPKEGICVTAYDWEGEATGSYNTDNITEWQIILDKAFFNIWGSGREKDAFLYHELGHIVQQFDKNMKAKEGTAAGKEREDVRNYMKKYEVPSNYHINVDEFEADQYAVNHTSRKALGKAMKKHDEFQWKPHEMKRQMDVATRDMDQMQADQLGITLDEYRKLKGDEKPYTLSKEEIDSFRKSQVRDYNARMRALKDPVLQKAKYLRNSANIMESSWIRGATARANRTILERSVEDYLRRYYSFTGDIQGRRNLSGMIKLYGEMAVPDLLINADSFDEATLSTVYSFLEGYFYGDPTMTQWLLESVSNMSHKESIYTDTMYENSLQGIVEACQNRNREVFREAKIVGDDRAMMEYSPIELHAIEDFISFKEFRMTGLEGDAQMKIYNEVMSLYEELDGLADEYPERFMESTNESAASIGEISKRFSSLLKRVTQSVKYGINDSNLLKKGDPYTVGAAFGTKSGPSKATVRSIAKLAESELGNEKGKWIKGVYLFVTIDIDSRKIAAGINPKKLRAAIYSSIRPLIDNKTLKKVNVKIDEADNYFCWAAFYISKQYAIGGVDITMTESVDQIVEDVADDIVPMMALPDEQIVEAMWLHNTINKKTGAAPSYLANNHDLDYGEDEMFKRSRSTDSSEGDDDDVASTLSDFKSPDEPSDEIDSIDEDDEDEDESDSSGGSSTPSGTNNYYYYTYTNSLNKNQNSFNKTHRDSHDISNDHSVHSRTDDHSSHSSKDDHSLHYSTRDSHSSRNDSKTYKSMEESADDEDSDPADNEEELNLDTPTSNLDEPLVPIFGVAKSYPDEDLTKELKDKEPLHARAISVHKMVGGIARGDHYSHALVSFNADLTDMYSYDNVGFVTDSINDDAWTWTDSIYICVMFVKKSDRDRMYKYCRWLVDHKDETKYAFSNIITSYVGKVAKQDKRYICSSFTSYILQCSNPKNLHRDYSRQRPEDLTIMPRAFYVTNVRDRDEFYEKKDEIKARVRDIFNDHREEIEDYNNHLPKMMLMDKVTELKTIDKILDWIMSRTV